MPDELKPGWYWIRHSAAHESTKPVVAELLETGHWVLGSGWETFPASDIVVLSPQLQAPR